MPRKSPKRKSRRKSRKRTKSPKKGRMGTGMKTNSKCKRVKQPSDKKIWKIAGDIEKTFKLRCKSRKFSFVHKCYAYTRDRIYRLFRNINSIEGRRVILAFFDLGYRLPNVPELSTVNILFCAIIYGVVAGLDWQYYLATPLGIHMLTHFFRDYTQARAFTQMLAHASFFGVRDTDILRMISQLPIPFCEDWWIVQLLIRRGLYHSLFRYSKK